MRLGGEWDQFLTDPQTSEEEAGRVHLPRWLNSIFMSKQDMQTTIEDGAGLSPRGVLFLEAAGKAQSPWLLWRKLCLVLIF